MALSALLWLWLGGSTDRNVPATGGELVATIRAEPRHFSRLVSPLAAEALIALLTHGTLVRVNPVTGDLEPRAASVWTTSPDGLIWTLTLREGLVFSDGVPCTAADVVFTIQALYDPQVQSAMAGSLRVRGKPLRARAVDDRTVEITFPAPYGPGLAILEGLPILPRHKLEAALREGRFREAWNVSTPPADLAGLGPFVLAEYAPGRHLRFARNPAFWGRDEAGRPLPYLDAITLSVVPEQNAEIVRLEAGEADLVNDFVRAEDLASLSRLEARGVVRLSEAGVSIDANALWFNLAPGARRAADRPWLQRLELRQAISHAVDRRAVVDTVYLGAAEPVSGPITPGHGSWHLPDLAVTAHDPARAGVLLEALGLIDRDGDGRREDAAGRPARFTIVTQRGHSIRERTVAVIQEQLRRVGLTVDVLATDPGSLFAQFSAGDYDAIFFGTKASSADPARNLDFWLTSGPFHFWHPGQAEPATAWERRIDDLIHEMAATLDRSARQRLFAEAQRLLAEHQPVITFAAPRVTVALSGRLRGATPAVIEPPVLWNAERLYLDLAGGTARN